MKIQLPEEPCCSTCAKPVAAWDSFCDRCWKPFHFRTCGTMGRAQGIKVLLCTPCTTNNLQGEST